MSNNVNKHNHDLEKPKQVEKHLWMCSCKKKGCKASLFINMLNDTPKYSGSVLTEECRNRKKDIVPEYDKNISTKAIKGIHHG